MANEYDIGDAVELYIEPAFKNSAGVTKDPTSIVLKVERPDGTLKTPTVPTHVGAVDSGLYTYTFKLEGADAKEGTWHYRYEGTGNGVDTAAEQAFYVRRSQFYP